jgi:dipeptidyl-peptidase-4
MINKKIALFLLIGAVSTLTFAQQKRLTVEDAVLRQRTTLAPERLSQAAFIPATTTLWWVAKSAGKECIIFHEAETNKTDTVFRIAKLDEMVQSTGLELAKLERFPFIKFVDKDKFRFLYSNVYFQYTISLNKIEVINRLPVNAENAEIEQATGNIAFVMANNVVLFNPGSYDNYVNGKGTSDDGVAASTKNYFLTQDGNMITENGKAVHRNEFGINKGLFWSPSGKKLAYYKQLQQNVTDYPLLKIGTTPARTENIKYPMAGAASHTVYVYIYNLENKLSYPVMIKGEQDQYITNISFSPDDEHLYAAIVNRDQNYMQLNRYDAKTGGFVKTVFTEESTKYVEPENPVLFVKNDRSRFIWQSERDGFNHLYLYRYSGELERQLTQGNFDVKEIIGFDEKGEKLYFMATANNGLDRHCYWVEIKTGKMQAFLTTPGTHTVAMSDNGKYFLDSYTSLSVPRKTVLANNEGKEIRVLQKSENPLLTYQKCDIKLFTIKAADGKTDLNCRMIYPHKIDSAKKYPVLVYLYGGPHAQMVTNSYLGGADMWLYYMAQQGYLVFTVDNRGSANRGIEFEQATFGNLGKNELFDQMMGVQYIQGLRYADTSRMGVFGWSFGGFMTINMMTRTNLFKAGVAGGPVTDWRLYEIMYTERYMDNPTQNAAGYDESNTLKYVKNLKGKMMIIHGTDDDVVVWQHSLNYIKECVDEGVQVDYFVYPGHKHNVLGKDRVHLMQKVTNYMDLHLKNSR